MEEEEIKQKVRENYARVARQETPCCKPEVSCCSGDSTLAQTVSERIGYTKEELGAVPEGANLGLGCGNPVALASLKEGEVVLDLGSGAGLDCFLAAQRVGESGKVIGVDMTPDMVSRARQNASKSGYRNIEFRLGEIENLPAADHSVDVIISNCVINLVPDKKRAFKEAFRVLKPGGRLIISDMVLLKELPEPVLNSIEAYVGCLAGAILKDDYLAAIKGAGFRKLKVVDETSFPIKEMVSDPLAKAIIESLEMPQDTVEQLASSVISLKVSAVKPK